MGFHCPHSRIFQVGGFGSVSSTKRQKLTKSLLSRSEKALSIKSKSGGASCDTAPFSKPYMFRSATDAASAAIDYSKGNIEDGVVDSPPSREPSRTPICSSSPLKRVSPSRGRSSSPTLQTDEATSRKLQLPLENAMEHPRLEDVVLSPSLEPAIHDDEVKPMGGVNDYTMAPHLGASATRRLRRLEDNGSCGLQSKGPRRLLLRNTRELRRYLGSGSSGSPLPYIDSVNSSLPKPPLQGSKSLSASEVPRAAYRSKRNANGSHSLGVCDAPGSGSRR